LSAAAGSGSGEDGFAVAEDLDGADVACEVTRSRRSSTLAAREFCAPDKTRGPGE
jgi:hypothetical protein